MYHVMRRFTLVLYVSTDLTLSQTVQHVFQCAAKPILIQMLTMLTSRSVGRSVSQSVSQSVTQLSCQNSSSQVAVSVDCCMQF